MNNKLRISRVRELMQRENIRSDRQLALKINIKPSNLSNYMTAKVPITDLIIDKLILVFPWYRGAWLRGEDDYPTNTDLIRAILQTGRDESEILESSLFGLARLKGFTTIRNLPRPQTGDVENIVANPHAGYTFERDGKKVSLSLADLNALENKIADYVEFELLHLIE